MSTAVALLRKLKIKTMKKIILFIVAVFCISHGFSQVQLVNDLNAEARTIQASFNKIIIAGGIDVYLTQSESEGVAVSASEQKFRDAIKTEIKDNTLKVYFDGDKTWSFKNRNLRAYISFRELELLNVSGASDVVVADEIRAPALSLKFSGASDFTGRVQVRKLDLNLSGASDIKISGTASVVKINSSGASDVDGFKLTTDICTATASGASDINVTVTNELTADASGSSEITYKGNPVIKSVNKSGSSAIKKG